MWRKIILTAIASIGLAYTGMAQYYTINLDSQSPAEQPVIDPAFSGNSIYLRAYIYESGAPIDLSSWAITFKGYYGQYSTQGCFTVNGVTSSNRVDFLGATNFYPRPYDDYWWSISGISLASGTKTFGTGTLKIRYDPSTSTNIFAQMEQANVSWLTNFVGAQVESNRLNIIILTTGKTDLVTYNAHVAAQANTNSGFQALHAAQANTNSGFEERIVAIEPISVLAMTNLVNAYASTGSATFSSHTLTITHGTNTGSGSTGSGFPLTTNANLAGFTMSNGSFVGNGSGLTNITAANTSVVISVAWTSNGVAGSSAIVTNIGSANVASFGFILPEGSNGAAATIGIAWTSNSAPGSAASVTNVGTTSAALLGFVIPTGSNGATGATGPAGSSTNQSVVSATNYVFLFSGEQVLTNGSIIQPYANVRLSTTNDLISLGNPQVMTNGILDGTIMYLRGAAGTGSIQFTNGNGVATDCALGFLLKPEDVLQFVFLDGKWTEVKRIDK